MADQKPNNRERVKEIVAGIEQNIQELFQSERYFDYLRTMSRFHSYSVNNTILIHMQRPNAATPVAGFQKWKQFGRHVKKGEKGLTIIAPTPLKKKIEEMKLDPDTKAPVLDQDGNAIFEEKTIEIPLFKPVKVFSADQTDGKPLPSLAADLTGDVQQYEAFMEALRLTSPVPIAIKPIEASMDGFFSHTTQSITVREGMSEIQTVCATVHEIAHAVLHNREQDRLTSAAGDTDKEPPKAKDKNTMEVEAESVSFAVCQYYGIDTSANSLGYIAGWSKDRSLPELKASLDTITKTVNGLITSIDKHFAEICKQRGIDLTPQQDAPDSFEQFAADLLDYMDQLHQAGIIDHPFVLDPREQAVADMLAEVQSGYYDGIRGPLTYIAEHTGQLKAKEMLERLDRLIQAKYELAADQADSPEKFVSDLCGYLTELYASGLVPAPNSAGLGEREKLAAALLPSVQAGNFSGLRHILDDIAQRTELPTTAVLRDRLEKLSDQWDAALVCKIEPYLGPSSTYDRSILHAYEKRDDQLIPREVFFVGTGAECRSVLAGLEAGTLTLRQVRQPDFEAPLAPERNYVYEMAATGIAGQFFIQARQRTEQGTLLPGEPLFHGKKEVCADLLDQLNSGALQPEDFFTVSAACVSRYTTKDGAELDAFVGPDDKVYLGRRDHYDNRGHYLNQDKSLLHVSDNEKLFGLLYESGYVISQAEMVEQGLFTMEDYAEFDALRVGTLAQFEEKDALTFAGKPFSFIQPEEGEPEQTVPSIPSPPEQAEEALYLLDDSVYLHVQAADAGWDYTLYTKHDMAQLDGGQLDGGNLSIPDVVEYVRNTEEIGTLAVDLAPIEVLEELRDRADHAMEAAVEVVQPEQPRDYAGELREHFAQEDASLLDTVLDEYPLPDASLTLDDLAGLGYSDSDLLPLSRDRAMELLDRDMTVYAVQTGENPAMVFDREDLMEQPEGMMFAVPCEEWEASPDFRQAVADRMDHQEDREKAFLDHAGDCFAIYQLRRDDSTRYLRYEPLETLRKAGESPRKGNYELAYTGALPPGSDLTVLDELYEKFNIGHPPDYMRPSMSVSDIIAIKKDGVVSCHYVDDLAFTAMPGFFQAENYLKNAEVTVEDDLGMIDGIINNGSNATVAELEQQARNGQPVSLTALAEAVHRERGEKKSVLERLKAAPPQQERKKSAPKKSAEKER